MKSPFRFSPPAAAPLLRNKLPRPLALILAGAVALGATTAAYAAGWSIVDLGTLGGDESVAQSINDAGVVSGFSQTASGTVHAFIYRRGVMKDLSNSEIAVNFGLAVNNAGLTVGYSDAAGGGRDFPVLFQSGSIFPIGQKPGRAHGINNSGTIVGEALIGPNGENQAFMVRLGRLVELGTLGGSSSVATSINNFGQAVGGSATAGDAASHAFLYDRPGMVDLGTLGGSFSIAFSINERREVVGESTTGGGNSHAFLWREQKMQDLGTLGGDFSRALSINNQGQIVGIGTNAADPGIRAFLYSDGVMTDLNSLPAVAAAGWFLASANGINDAGQIVGSGVINGRTHGFLLAPPGKTDRHGRLHNHDGAEEGD